MRVVVAPGPRAACVFSLDDDDDARVHKPAKPLRRGSDPCLEGRHISHQDCAIDMSAPDVLKPLIEALCARRDLTRAEAESGIRAVIAGVDNCQTAAFLVLLRAKGETPAEVAGMVTAMRDHMVRVDAGGSAVDIVGTGGDGHHTVNFSTAASFVAAACGARVAKHGNRSVSSQCGSADVLEELGVKIALSATGVERCIREAGIAFMFAPGFHPAMKNVVPVRKALGVRTVFNILGPLLNPAGLSRGLIGVYSDAMVPLMAEALHQLGADLVMVVHCGGLDELAPIVRHRAPPHRPSSPAPQQPMPGQAMPSPLGCCRRPRPPSPAAAAYLLCRTVALCALLSADVAARHVRCAHRRWLPLPR